MKITESDIENVKDRVKIRPWSRILARTYDYWIMAIILMVVLRTPFFTDIYSIFSDVLVIFIWLFIEPILLSTKGTTPGKWLFNISVVTKDGDNLSFYQAMKRSFSIWFRAYAMGIPVANVATLIVSYDNMLSNGIANWDNEGGFRVLHGPIDIRRLLIMTLILFIVVMIVANMMSI